MYTYKCTYGYNFFVCLDVSSLANNKSVFSEYLFYPEMNKKTDVQKRKKERLPSAITGPEWRRITDLKFKEKEEQEKKKANSKLLREGKVKIKQELEGDLTKLKPQKAKVMKEIKELQLVIEKNKAEQVLLQVNLKTELLEEAQDSMKEQIKILKDKIKNDKMHKDELLKTKANLIREVKTIRSLHNNKRNPLKDLNT